MWHIHVRRDNHVGTTHMPQHLLGFSARRSRQALWLQLCGEGRSSVSGFRVGRQPATPAKGLKHAGSTWTLGQIRRHPPQPGK